MKKKIKAKQKKRVQDKGKQGQLNLEAAQTIAVKALLSTFAPDQSSHSIGLLGGPDEIMSLIYAGANHLAMRIQKMDSSQLGNPTEMRIRVKHDPCIKETQIGFSFFTSMFTIYTPENISQKVTFDEASLTLGDFLRNQLVDRLPSAEARLALTIAEVCSQGGRVAYVQKFLPKVLQESLSFAYQRKKKKKTSGVRR